MLGAVQLAALSSLLVGPEVEVVQRDGLLGATEVVLTVGVVVPGDRVGLLTGFLGRLDPNVAVTLQAGACSICRTMISMCLSWMETPWLR